MKAYLNYFKLRVITNLQYRAAALAGIGTQLFFGIVYIMLYLALYESNTNVNAPMNLESIITYMWLQQSFFAVVYPYIADHQLLNMIKNGNLAYELVRPQDFYLKFYIKMISERLVAASLRCIPIIILALLLPEPYSLKFPVSTESFILFVISLFMSCLLVTALTLLMHIITMFTMEHGGVLGIYNVMAEVFMGMIIPLPFLPKFMKTIGIFLPFRFIGDFPYRVYCGDISIIEGKTLLIGSFIWTLIAILIGYLISKIALKKAVIQGG
jgi:ABC-2 type transport system permease protein